VVRGEFSRGLYRHLEALAVQVSPLRERPIAIPPLVQALARRIARHLGSDGELSFSPAAMGRLQTYMWPGNLVELEAVLLRTLTFLADSALDGRVIEDHEILFTAEDALRPRTQVRQPAVRGEIGRFPDLTGEGRPSPSEASVDVLAGALAPSTEDEHTGDPVFESIVAGLAHDLRNPMTTIKTFASAISAGNMAADTARELGERVSQECDRLNACLEDLERYGGFGEPARERVDFAALVRQSVTDREDESEPRVVVSGAGPVDMTGDPFQLRFVADNVVEAAREELGPGAKVEIEVQSPDEVTIEVASGQGPVTKLRRLIEAGDDALSWRIQLARAVAVRNGCVVEVNAAGDGLKTVCRPQGGVARGQQTSRINS